MCFTHNTQCNMCTVQVAQINALPLKKTKTKKTHLISRNIWGLLKDLTCKQYISWLVVKPNEPLLRTGSSLTMFITDLKKQLKSTRCWGRTGPGEAPPGRMRSGTRSSFWKLKATKGGNKDSDIPVGPYETGHPTEALGREALTADCQKEQKD